MATKDELKTLKMIQEILAGSFAIEGGVRGEGQEFDANYGDGVRELPLSTSARGGGRGLTIAGFCRQTLLIGCVKCRQWEGGGLKSRKSCGRHKWKPPYAGS